MSQRFKDAYEIQQHGACNPCGIAGSLRQACEECLAEGVSQREDPAVRLIVHQLAYLCNAQGLDQGLWTYRELMDACKAKIEA